MNKWSDDEVCPACGSEETAPAHIPDGCPILLIGEFPGIDEVRKGIPFIGKTGNVLRTELALKGIDLNRLGRANMWLHLPNGNDDCLQAGVQAVIKAAQGKQLILLIGSETVKFFCKESVTSVNGLQVTSPYLSAPIIMACIQPASVFHKSIGEVRFAISEFAKVADTITREIEVQDEW